MSLALAAAFPALAQEETAFVPPPSWDQPFERVVGGPEGDLAPRVLA